MYKQSQGTISSNLSSSKPIENDLFSQASYEEDKYSNPRAFKNS